MVIVLCIRIVDSNVIVPHLKSIDTFRYIYIIDFQDFVVYRRSQVAFYRGSDQGIILSLLPY